MTLNGEILDTVYCENNDKFNGPLLDMTFCVLNNARVITHEVRNEGHSIVKREKTGKVTMTCDLFRIYPRRNGIVCTSLGIIPTDRHDITELLLKVALNTITRTLLSTTLYHQV
jgi:hypothetical protein